MKKNENSIFENNIAALLAVNPKLASNIFAVKTNEKFEIFMGKDPMDINIIDKETKRYLYEFPLKDTEEKIQKIEKEFSRYPSLFFYGFGNGIFYKLLLANEAHQFICVFEPEIEILYIALNLLDFSKEILNQRFMIFHSTKTNYAELYELSSLHSVRPYVKLYNLHIDSPFYDIYSDDITKINENFSRAITQVVYSHGNCSRDAIIGISHHIQNIPDVIKNYRFTDLINKRKGLVDTAIIVSTGPSLTKQLSLLKEYSPYVSVICVDASLPILQKHKIKPDYITSIERVEATSHFFKNLDEEIISDSYFILPSLAHKLTIKNLKNQHLCIAIRPLKFMSSYELDKYGYLGIGMSASNSAYELAYLLGHKNIILIGQDLAYSDDGKSHAQNHIFGENEKAPPSKDALMAIKYGGQGLIETTGVWNLFRNYFESEIAVANKENIITYNCTQGGSRINGAVEEPFLEVLERLIDKKKPKILPKTTLPCQKEISLELNKAIKNHNKIKKYGEKLKIKIEKLFLNLVEKIEKLEKLEKENKLEKINFDELLKISHRIDKIKAEVESKNFTNYYLDTIQSYIYHQELELAKIMVRPSETEIEKKAKLIEWIIAHRYWLFSLAGGIDIQLSSMKNNEKALNSEDFNF